MLNIQIEKDPQSQKLVIIIERPSRDFNKIIFTIKTLHEETNIFYSK